MRNEFRIIKAIFFKLSRWSARLIGPASVTAAFACFYAALTIANPHDPRLLAYRFAQFPPHTVSIPSVASWPLEYLWMIGKPWFDLWASGVGGHGRMHASPASPVLFIAGVVLVALTNYLIWARQDANNRDARIAVWIWFISLALNFFDLVRVAVLPETWDTRVLIDGVTFGEVLRAAETFASLCLLCCWRVLHNNRVEPHLFGAFAKIMNPVRGGLTVRGAVAVTVLPFAIYLAQPILTRAWHVRGNEDAATVVLESANLLLLLWSLFLQGMWRHLCTVAALGEKIIGMQPPIGQTGEPPPSPERY